MGWKNKKNSASAVVTLLGATTAVLPFVNTRHEPVGANHRSDAIIILRSTLLL